MYEHCQTSGIFITLPPICATFPHKETLTYTNSTLGFVEETLRGLFYRKPQRKTIGVSRDFLNSPGSAIVRAAKWRSSHERDTEPAEMSDAGLTSGVGWSQMDWTHTHGFAKKTNMIHQRYPALTHCFAQLIMGERSWHRSCSVRLPAKWYEGQEGSFVAL